MNQSRRRLIAGNWKMNGLKVEGLALAKGLAERASASAPAAELLICPPATLLALAASAVAGSPVAIGGQDCHPEPSGAHTGDIAAEMLADIGCRYVILGHSERRSDHGESDGQVRHKAEAALRAGLVPIICVGESENERAQGQAQSVVAHQLHGSLPEGASPQTVVIAYEPVWAIGTGRTATTGDVAEMHAHIRGMLGPKGSGMRILYGGSVKAANAADLLGLEDVDGALVGGASLKLEEFWAIATCR
ncbi:MAG TPA: triose-phosphate isomerase [Alphaproteobacteria bacterium]|nr:triose-phosphate isomerase [Alphaproteobacteria bacterium]